MLFKFREAARAMLPRGGGTSQSGQTVNAALVVDCSKRLTKILSLDAHARTCTGCPHRPRDQRRPVGEIAGGVADHGW